MNTDQNLAPAAGVHPPQQYLGPELVMAELADDGGRSVMTRTVPQILLLAI